MDKAKSHASGMKGGATNRTELLSAMRDTSKNLEAAMGLVRFDNASEVEKSELKWPNIFSRRPLVKH